MLKYSKTCEGAGDLQEALTSILGILKAVNDSMHLIAITGYEVRHQIMYAFCILQLDRYCDVSLYDCLAIYQ